MVRDRLVVVVLAMLAAALLALPGVARADVTVDSFSVTPSTTAAGAHPDVVIDEAFSYGGSSSDSVLNTALHLPAGLLGNPQASPKCAGSDFEADMCPDDTRVGSTVVGASIGGLLPTNSNGDIYNLVPDAAHPAVLGIVVRPVAGKIFLKSPISLRTSGDVGIESPVDNQPNSVSGLSVQIKSTTITLFGTRPWLLTPFMSNPTSCKPATSSLGATSHEAPTHSSSASSTFTPTDCDKEPFAPKLTATMGAPGATTRNSHVPFEATITQAVGEASQLSAMVTLPASLSSGVSTVPILCTADQLAAAACPAAARLGTATIASPLLPTPVRGPVFAVLRPGQLPGVGVEFGGVLPFVLSGNSGLSSGRLENLFTGLPDVPLTSLSLAIDGGTHGLLVATSDICSGPTPMVDGAFTGQNGSRVNVAAPVTVVGCGKPVAKKPHANATARGLRGRHPLLQITVLKGTSKLRSVSVTLPKVLVVTKPKRGLSAVGAKFRLSKKRITLSRTGRLTLKLPSGGATRVTARLSRGSFHASRTLRSKLSRHRTTELKLAIRTVDTAGHRTTLHLKFTGKR